MVFIGYFEGAKAYRMLDPGSGCIHVSRDVIFDKNRGWEWDSMASGGESAMQREFTVRFYTAQAPADEVNGGVPEEGMPPPPPGQVVPLPDLATPPSTEATGA
jgi:hypothetical protein